MRVVKKITNKIKCQYAIPDYDFKNLNMFPKELHFVIYSKHFQVLIMAIRRKTTVSTIDRKKERMNQTNKQQTELRKEKLKAHHSRSRSK